jgi:hypothetical protein
MWNERKMPERWYGLLRERMQVEEQRMRVIKDGDFVEHDDMEEFLAQADSLDREMPLVMRQVIAALLSKDEARRNRGQRGEVAGVVAEVLTRFPPSSEQAIGATVHRIP